MHYSIKSSLQRLRSILSANIVNFILGFFLGAIIIVGFLGYDQLMPESTKLHTDSVTAIYLTAVSIFFILPVLTYLFIVTSAKVNGVTHVDLNVRTLKRNLFFSAGVLWLAIGAMAILAIKLNYPTTMLAAAILGNLGWLTINKIVINYVTNY